MWITASNSYPNQSKSCFLLRDRTQCSRPCESIQNHRFLKLFVNENDCTELSFEISWIQLHETLLHPKLKEPTYPACSIASYFRAMKEGRRYKKKKKPFISYVHIYINMQNDFIHIYTGLIINTVQKRLKRYQPTFYKLSRYSRGGEKRTGNRFHKVTTRCKSLN